LQDPPKLTQIGIFWFENMAALDLLERKEEKNIQIVYFHF
jgi:hypothetical protein